MKMMVLFVAAIALSCVSSDALRAQDQDDSCPCMKAAKEMGFKGEQLTAIAKVRDAAWPVYCKISQSDDMRRLNKDMADATKEKNKEKMVEVQAKQKELLKPALEKLHNGLKGVLSAELYAKYNEKLPIPFKL